MTRQVRARYSQKRVDGTQSPVSELVWSQLKEEKAERAYGDECGTAPFSNLEYP
jgi:hypothetical protein